MPYIVPLVPDIAVRPQINHRDSDSDNFENSSWNKHKVLENEEETLEKLDPSQRKHIETQTDFYTTGLLPYAVPLVLDIVVPGMKELILWHYQRSWGQNESERHFTVEKPWSRFKRPL